MGSRTAKYGYSFSMGLRSSMEYRLNFVFSILSAASPVLIQTVLWTRIYGPDSADVLFGFTYSQMIAYTVIANLVSRLVRTGFEYEVNWDIKSGGLDRYLVKPIGYFGFRLFSFLGGKSTQAVVITILIGAAVQVMRAVLGFQIQAAAVLAFAAGILTAFMLNYLIFWCVGMLGFVLTEIGFLFEAVRIVIITASGGIFPLSVFGPTGEKILGALPFRFTIQFPTELLCGRVPASEILPGFVMAFAWTAALTAVSWMLWKSGVRRFAAVGS
jgi:ABC-2 type transport system permease protein